MGNKLQIFIFKLSNCVIPFILFGLIWLFKVGFDIISFIFICASLIFLFSFILSMRFAFINLAVTSINATNLSKMDNNILIYIGQVVPAFISLINDLGTEPQLRWITSIVGIILPLLFNGFANKTNILLELKGYHFYNCSISSGVSGYVLISKRNFRKVAKLRQVKRLFENVFLDVEE